MREKNSSALHWLLTVAFWIAVVYLGVQIFSTRVAIGQKEQELATATTRLAEQEAENEELSRTLSGSTQSIVEQVARDELGYAQPNQRVFVDVTGK